MTLTAFKPADKLTQSSPGRGAIVLVISKHKIGSLTQIVHSVALCERLTFIHCGGVGPSV